MILFMQQRVILLLWIFMISVDERGQFLALECFFKHPLPHFSFKDIFMLQYILTNDLADSRTPISMVDINK